MKMIIIGGDAAGMSAAMQIVHKRKDAEITVLERGNVYSYAQCGLPYYLSDTIPDTDELIARSIDFFREKGIDARVFHEVTHVDAEKQMVYGTNLENGEAFELPYDTLLAASGGSPDMIPVGGAELEGIHTMKTIPDIEKIKQDFKDKEHITIIGAGYIGLEAAENLREAGKSVRIINRSDRLGSGFDEYISDALKAEAHDYDVELVLKEDVHGFVDDGSGRVRAVQTNRGTYQTDGVLVAVGITPNTSYLNGTGVHLHASGAVKVDAYMRTNVKNIYAAGDCATQYHRVKEVDDYVPLGTHANKQGRIAGANISGERKTFQGMLGTAIFRFFRLTVGRTGISMVEAEEAGFDVSCETFEPSPIAGYFPGNKAFKMEMIKDNQSGRLIGLQAAGVHGVDKRIDTASVMIYNEMTVDDIQNLDISYAPPFNSTWDPIQKAARRL
ncbi:FAD-dependent oxidoreductase [Alkalicoccus urumqiensis]|uniref:CoA-disulfide reductase n=1 Tax=Alkalicoccus urumqiensis TaxID=1548213 RepID=A0A2P6MHI6_ALKUR|nr:FAD-dependent oxidoreductase [Alkalicoccus urumqiensis]PRO65752.1 CoA-disulfide reductase [Alkalicoccus urumqiensis]